MFYRTRDVNFALLSPHFRQHLTFIDLYSSAIRDVVCFHVNSRIATTALPLRCTQSIART